MELLSARDQATRAAVPELGAIVVGLLPLATAVQVFLTLGFSAFLLGEAVSPEMTVFAGGVALRVWFGRKMPIAQH